MKKILIFMFISSLAYSAYADEPTKVVESCDLDKAKCCSSKVQQPNGKYVSCMYKEDKCSISGADDTIAQCQQNFIDSTPPLLEVYFNKKPNDLITPSPVTVYATTSSGSTEPTKIGLSKNYETPVVTTIDTTLNTQNRTFFCGKDNVILTFNVNNQAFPINTDATSINHEAAPSIEEYDFSFGDDSKQWSSVDDYENWNDNHIFKTASGKITGDCKNITITATRAYYQKYTCVYKNPSDNVYYTLDWSYTRHKVSVSFDSMLNVSVLDKSTDAYFLDPTSHQITQATGKDWMLSKNTDNTGWTLKVNNINVTNAKCILRHGTNHFTPIPTKPILKKKCIPNIHNSCPEEDYLTYNKKVTDNYNKWFEEQPSD